MSSGRVRRTSVSPRIVAEEYGAFLALVKGDPVFPPNHVRWVERMNEEDAQREASGLLLQPMIVHPEEFADWCSGSGVDPGFYTHAFATAKAHLGKR